VVRIPMVVRFSAPVQGRPIPQCSDCLLINEVKVTGAWRLPHTPSSAEVKESVELYLYSPVDCSRMILSFYLAVRVKTVILHYSWISQALNFVLCR